MKKTHSRGAALSPRAREMARLLEEQAGSGLTVRAFAEQRGLRTGTLHWWRRELRLRGAAGAPGTVIVPVKLVEPPAMPSPRTAFRVEVTNQGRSIEVPSDFDPKALRRLLEVLSPC